MDEIEIYKKALSCLAERMDKEGCYYCPYYDLRQCELKTDSDECINKIVEGAIGHAKYQIENNKGEQIEITDLVSDKVEE